MSSLFRKEAVLEQRTETMGDILLIRPLSFTLLTSIAVGMAILVCCFLIWGTYTQRSTVAGQLIPDTGLVKVFTPQAGIVQEKKVSEAQHVKAGDVLYILSSERHSSRIGETQATISQQVDQRLTSLREEMKKTQALHTEEHDGLVKKIAGLKDELTQLKAQITDQNERVKLADATFKRYQYLLTKGYIPSELVQQKQEDLLDQKNRLQSLERERISTERELATQQTELTGLGLKQHNQLAELERSLSATNQELTESEAKRRLVITAPEEGIATTVMADIGQSVDSNLPLVIIVPENSPLHANLYAPSRAIGFVNPGDKVLIRYQAYPYQKFGHHAGIIESVSKTALPANDLINLGNVLINTTSNNSEPLYRIKVKLAEQAIPVYGKPQALQAGMLLEADILQEKRHLYEWVLEPLYSLSGKL